MSYLNKDKYLTLKQSLVYLQAKRLGAIANCQDDLDEDWMVKSVVDKLEGIKKDYTQPFPELAGFQLPIDIATLRSSITRTINKEFTEQLSKLDNLDGLNELIFVCPNKKPIEDNIRGNTEAGNLFTINEGDITEIQALIHDISGYVRYYAESEGSEPLVYVLTVINFMEIVDYIFDLVNDNYSAVSINGKRES